MVLRELRNHLSTQLARIRASVGGSVVIEARAPHTPENHAEFALVYRYVDQSTGETKVVELLFSREFTYGRSAQLDPAAWRCELDPCRYRKAFIQKVLQARGVL